MGMQSRFCHIIFPKTEKILAGEIFIAVDTQQFNSAPVTESHWLYAMTRYFFSFQFSRKIPPVWMFKRTVE